MLDLQEELATLGYSNGLGIWEQMIYDRDVFKQVSLTKRDQIRAEFRGTTPKKAKAPKEKPMAPRRGKGWRLGKRERSARSLNLGGSRPGWSKVNGVWSKL